VKLYLKVNLKVDPSAYIEKSVDELLKKKWVYSLFTVLWISDLIGNIDDRQKEAVELLKTLQMPDGSVKGTPDSTGFYIIALRKAGVPCEDEKIQRGADCLIKSQRVDGGWGSPEKSVTFIAAWTLASLHSAKQLTENVLEKAVNFLRDAQNEDGGWTNYNVGGKGQSCHGITPSVLWDGCGICDIPSLRDSSMVKRAVNFITSLQKEDGGWADDVLVTRLSVGALAAAGLTIKDEAIKRGVLWFVDHQNPDGSWGKDTWDTVAILDRFKRLGVEWEQ